jgi:NodT family efflux transporter outer membrane factor (OMF) lipoprotein
MKATWLVLAACTVGPPYRRPSAPVPATATHYKEGWKLATPSDAVLRGTWWTMFREPELDCLEARLALDNQTIKQAFASFMAARAQIALARAQYFPTVTAAPSATKARGSPPVYTLPLDASWAPDLFGRVRESVRQAQASAQVSAADLENQRLVEQATLAQLYFQIRGYDALADVLEATIAADRKILELAKSRYATGIDTELSVVQADQALQIAIAQAQAAALTRAGYEHAIATLIGVPATSFSMPKRAVLAAPPAIPTGMPSQLLERRPDIAAAERQMAAANAQIGIGYAAYFPTLNLTASAGFTSSALASLVSWPSRFWAVGASLVETVFDGGARGAAIEQAKAAYHGTVAGYRQTVLTAFQQVEDALSQVQILGDEIEAQRKAVALAEQAVELETVRYQTGIDPFLSLMTEQILLLSARQTLVTLEIQRMLGAVALIEALGGGWDSSTLWRGR